MVSDILSSLLIIVVGNLLGVFLGVGVSLILGKKNAMHYIFDLLKGIPNVALFPIALILFGIGDMSRIAIIFWSSFFINIISAYKGLFHDIDKEVVEASYIDGAGKFKTMIKVRLPNALISILYGVKNSIAVSFVSLMSIEALGADRGIGYRIFYYYNLFDYKEMYKWIAIASFMTLILNVLLDLIIKKVRIRLYG